jgi:hypothetical protein
MWIPFFIRGLYFSYFQPVWKNISISQYCKVFRTERVCMRVSVCRVNMSCANMTLHHLDDGGTYETPVCIKGNTLCYLWL